MGRFLVLVIYWKSFMFGRNTFGYLLVFFVREIIQGKCRFSVNVVMDLKGQLGFLFICFLVEDLSCVVMVIVGIYIIKFVLFFLAQFFFLYFRFIIIMITFYFNVFGFMFFFSIFLIKISNSIVYCVLVIFYFLKFFVL